MRSASLPAVQHLVWIGLRVVVVGGGGLQVGIENTKQGLAGFLQGLRGTTRTGQVHADGMGGGRHRTRLTVYGFKHNRACSI